MSVSDPIANAITRIRNAQRAKHGTVEIVMNNTIESIVNILKKEGFIEGISPFKDGPRKMAKIELRYDGGSNPVIRGIDRVSKPGRRIYQKWSDIRPYLNSIGVGIYSTPKGVLSDKDALNSHVGGEYLCRVW